MLKFDEMNAPEDANRSSGNYFSELMNSKPSLDGLHQTKGTSHKVLEKTPPECSHNGQAAW